MQQSSKPVSRVKVAVMWVILLGNLLFWCGFWLWHHRSDGPPPAADAGEGLFRAIGMIVLGGFFLVVGMGGYLAVFFSNCLTFNFNQPVWNNFRGKLFVANIFVPLLCALGLGFGLSAFLTPVLLALGLSSGIASLLPVLAMVALLQIAQMWVQIWAPLEKRIICKRLMAQGVTDDQLQTAILVGLSDPTRSSFKKFGGVEDDIGALWVSPERLVYFGDNEQFALTRDELTQVERRADAGSATILDGLAHVILHVKLPDGSERPIRLHTEGLLTMGKKRKGMDELASAIAAWHSSAAPATAA
jgi:hypothetical protein